jgi:hypothetical protein
MTDPCTPRDIQLIGLICAVELVPVSEPQCSQMIPAVSQSLNSRAAQTSLKLPNNPQGPGRSPVLCPNSNFMFFDEFGHDAASNWIYEASNDYSTRTSTSSACSYNSAEYDITSVAQIAELTDTTLIGSKVVQPHLIDIDNQKTLLFVFSVSRVAYSVRCWY